LAKKSAGLMNQFPTNKTGPYVKKSAGLMNQIFAVKKY
jgi:hypothetical protein